MEPRLFHDLKWVDQQSKPSSDGSVEVFRLSDRLPTEQPLAHRTHANYWRLICWLMGVTEEIKPLE